MNIYPEDPAITSILVPLRHNSFLEVLLKRSGLTAQLNTYVLGVARPVDLELKLRVCVLAPVAHTASYCKLLCVIAKRLRKDCAGSRDWRSEAGVGVNPCHAFVSSNDVTLSVPLYALPCRRLRPYAVNGCTSSCTTQKPT